MLDLRATKYYIRSQNSVTIVTIYYKIKDPTQTLFPKIQKVNSEQEGTDFESSTSFISIWQDTGNYI